MKSADVAATVLSCSINAPLGSGFGHPTKLGDRKTGRPLKRFHLRSLIDLPLMVHKISSILIRVLIQSAPFKIDVDAHTLNVR